MAQVAFDDNTCCSSSSPLISMSILNSPSAFPFLLPLVRQPSAPEILGESVFALIVLLSECYLPIITTLDITITISMTTTAWDGAHMLSLLINATSAEPCHRIISSPRWLRLYQAFLHVSFTHSLLQQKASDISSGTKALVSVRWSNYWKNSRLHLS